MGFRDAEVINSSRVFLTLRRIGGLVKFYSNKVWGGGAFQPWYDHLKWMMVPMFHPRSLRKHWGVSSRDQGNWRALTWPLKGSPDLPVPYIFRSKRDPGKPISQVITIDPWFQIYRELEDEGLLFSPSQKKVTSRIVTSTFQNYASEIAWKSQFLKGIRFWPGCF